jgi:hypothetical protein
MVQIPAFYSSQKPAVFSVIEENEHMKGGCFDTLKQFPSCRVAVFSSGDRFHDCRAGEAGGGEATGAGDRVKARNQIVRRPNVQGCGIAVGGPFVGVDHGAFSFQ